MAQFPGKITVDPPDPVIGQSVFVQVEPNSGNAFDPKVAQTIHINRIPATECYLQFMLEGDNPVTVQAVGPSGPASKTITVQVKPLPLPSPGVEALISTPVWPSIGVPFLQLYYESHNTKLVGFSVGQIGQPSPAISPGSLTFNRLRRIPRIELISPNSTPLYSWDFGDGTTFQSTKPEIQHDFSPALNPLIEDQSFHVSVINGGRKVTRTVCFNNLYATLKRTQGKLHPTASPSGFANRTSSGFNGTFTVFNPEPQDVSLRSRRFVPLNQSPSQPVAASPVESIAITLPAQKTTSVPVFARFDQVSKNSIGFGVYFQGTAAGNEDVRVNVHFDLEPFQRPKVKSQLWDSASKLFLNSAKQALISNNLKNATSSQLRPLMPSQNFSAGRELLSNDLHMLTTRTLLPLAKPPPNVSLPSSLHLPPGFQLPSTNIIPPGTLNFDPAPVAVGNPCDPDNLPENVPPGLACQATTDTELGVTAARFRNAWKGHSVLAPGGIGPIGLLLTQVDVPQKYSHCGIMTNNFEQITHCTASTDRLLAYPIGSIPLEGTEPTHGFRPDTIKYGWPGTITQTVENCIEGSSIPDPETPGQPYSFQDFNAFPEGAMIQNTWYIIQPLVLKPDPMLDDDALRQKLQAVADDAFNQNGKYHHRFYCYTDPTIATRDAGLAPVTHQWQDGTHPGVCSSFIWEMMKRNGIHLAGAGTTVQPSDLTQTQKDLGAKVGHATPDGLYLYNAQERLRAANFLNNMVRGMVANKEPSGLSGVINFGTKISTHVSNEIVNAFARDVVGLDDDDDSWKNTVDSSAVSPDDMMKWNGPNAPTPGPYGYLEPLVYTELRVDIITINKWVQVQRRGTLSGTVTFNGAPVPGAAVSLGGAMINDSDGAGHYTIQNVPFGRYTAFASHTDQSGQMASASVPVDVESDNSTLNISVALPPAMYRHIVVDGFTHIHYTKHFVFKTEDHQQDFPFHGDLAVAPDDRLKSQSFPATLDDASTNLVITVGWHQDMSIGVHVEFTLHDQTSTRDTNIPQDGVQQFGRPDQADIQLNADNDQAWPIFTVTNKIAQG